MIFKRTFRIYLFPSANFGLCWDIFLKMIGMGILDADLGGLYLRLFLIITDLGNLDIKFVRFLWINYNCIDA